MNHSTNFIHKLERLERRRRWRASKIAPVVRDEGEKRIRHFYSNAKITAEMAKWWLEIEFEHARSG